MGDLGPDADVLCCVRLLRYVFLVVCVCVCGCVRVSVCVCMCFHARVRADSREIVLHYQKKRKEKRRIKLFISGRFKYIFEDKKLRAILFIRSNLFYLHYATDGPAFQGRTKTRMDLFHGRIGNVIEVRVSNVVEKYCFAPV